MEVGVCSICLQEAELTKEHVPPKSAFNDKTVIAFEFEKALKIQPWDSKPWARRDGISGTAMIRGAGFNAICTTCNSEKCNEYATEFGRWAKQASTVFDLVEARRNPCPLFFGRPLRFMKQVAVMMLVTGGPDFTRANPDLQRFVLDKGERRMGRGIRIHAYFNPSRYKGRFGTNMIKGDGVANMEEVLLGGILSHAPFSLYSEVSKFPFGFTLTRDSRPPDKRLTDITYLSEYSYDEFAARVLALPVFPVVTVVGEYLTPEEAWLASNLETGPDFFRRSTS